MQADDPSPAGDDSVVVVFTAKTADDILRKGGTSSWVLDAKRARRCRYVVCTRNTHADWAKGGGEPHGSAFLVGIVSGVTPVDDNRYRIEIDRYVNVVLPEIWQGWRNPVRYTTMAALGIDPAALSFRELSEAPELAEEVAPLSIAAAKRGLALGLGVPEQAIEITVRA